MTYALGRGARGTGLTNAASSRRDYPARGHPKADLAPVVYHAQPLPRPRRIPKLLTTGLLLRWSASSARATGLEPATTGSTVRYSNDAKATHVEELRRDAASEVPTVVPSPPGAVLAPAVPPDLARVVAAWGDLPDAIRGAISAIIASSATHGGEVAR